MDFSCMPALVIEEVAAYLTLNDVIACSGVSRQWRRAFDSDQIWKRYSTFHKDYFKKQVINQRNSSLDLIDGCNAKKNVFQELQVRKNIVEGKHDLVQIDIGRVYCDNLLDLVDDVGNHWLFISCAKNLTFESVHMIEVWNVNDKPIKHQTKETPLGVTKRLIDSQMKAYKNKLYYWESNVMIAFEFSHPEYSLTTIFKIDCPYIEGTRNRNAMVCKPNMVLTFVFTDVHSHLSTAPWIHVWGEDVNTLYKNYSADEVDHLEAQIAHNDESVSYSKQPSSFTVKDGGSSDNVLLAYSFIGPPTFISLVLFNIRTFKLTTLFANAHQHLTIGWDFILDNQNVGVFLHYPAFIQKLLFYSTDGNLIDELSVRFHSDINSFLFIHSSTRHYRYNQIIPLCRLYSYKANGGKNVLIIQDESVGQVTVFDMFNKREISTFRLPKHTMQGQGSFGFLHNNFVILQELKKTQFTLAVWDFEYGKRLYDIKRLKKLADIYMFNYSKNYRTPSKIFGIKDPHRYYARESNGEIVMLSFL